MSRFELVARIGEGGMGVVWEAQDRDRGVRVALKTMHATDAAAWLQLKNELRALQDIRHPNLVGLGELFEEEGRLFFTMELVRGSTILEYVWAGTVASAKGPAKLPELETAPRFDQAEALGGGFDVDRVRDAFAQVGAGL